MKKSQTVSFAEVLSIVNGKNQKAVESKDGRYPIYGSGGIMGRANDYLCDGNTVIIGRKGSINNPIYVNEPFWNVDTAFGLVADRDKLDSKFLYYFCVKFDFTKLNTTVTIPSLTKANLLKVQLPLPPLSEQRRIAAVLDKISEMKRNVEARLKKLDLLVKARFNEMFGDPVTNPKGWKSATFRDASLRLSDGPFGSNLKSSHYSESGVRVIRLGNIGAGDFMNEDKSYIPYSHYEYLKKYTCRKGELIFGTLGEPNFRACIIPDYVEIAVNKSDCVHYIPKPELLENRFVCHYVNASGTLELAASMFHGQTRSRVSSGQIAQMPIFLPPLPLQRQFAEFVEKVDALKAAAKAELEKVDLLYRAKLQEYFG